MNTLIWVIASVHGALFFNAIANLFWFQRRRSRTFEGPLPKVSVLVPARNESANLPRLLASFDLQDHPSAELIVYDDLSEDNTFAIVSNHANDKVRVLPGVPLPETWVGKVHGCYQLSLAATGAVFLFIDADTEFRSASALKNMCSRFAARPESTILTGMTLLKGKGQLIVTMVGNLILACIPWWLGRRVPIAAMAGVNGQCWMIDREDYRRLEPHKEVYNQVLEDIMIGRYAFRNGLRPILDDVRQDLAVYMYTGFGDAWKGFQKNTASILGSSAATSLITLLTYFVIFILAPFLNLWFVVSLYGIKWITDRATGQPWTVTILAPVSYVLAIFIGLDSILTRSRGRIQWKGRTIP